MIQISAGYKDENRASCCSKHSTHINNQMTLASLDTGCFNLPKITEMCGREAATPKEHSGTLRRRL